MFKLWIGSADRRVQSAAQLRYNHEIEGVGGLQVLCVADLGVVWITGFKSEICAVGVPNEEDNAVLVTPEKDVPNGCRMY